MALRSTGVKACHRGVGVSALDPCGFEGLCRELVVEPSGINELVFNLAPMVLRGEGQLSIRVRPELRVVEGGPRADPIAIPGGSPS